MPNAGTTREVLGNFARPPGPPAFTGSLAGLQPLPSPGGMPVFPFNV